jgi:hypothetical protein
MECIYTVADYNKIYTVPTPDCEGIAVTSAVRKAVNENFDVGFDWKYVIETPDTITSSTWSCTPSGLTVGTGVIDLTVTKVPISGGTEGTVYSLVNQIETDNGDKYELTKSVIVSSK